ncbi:MAG: 50S ribosomal protein L29 [Deltaproteobacteria bacterium]|nr:50S ribosomal protein L29 [Deltaproteobacteria bacterium]
MKPSELREKSADELLQVKAKIERELMDTRFKDTTGQLKDMTLIQKLKADIARIHTILGEKSRQGKA